MPESELQAIQELGKLLTNTCLMEINFHFEFTHPDFLVLPAKPHLETSLMILMPDDFMVCISECLQ